MDKSAPPAFLIVLFPFFFVGLWCAVCLLLSAIGGWRRLAGQFPARGQPSGTSYHLQSGKVGWVAYRSCLTIHTSSAGIYLSVWLPFRLGHPPLFIPWEAVQNVVTHRFLWTETIVFNVGTPTIATLQLPGKIFTDRNAVSKIASPLP